MGSSVDSAWLKKKISELEYMSVENLQHEMQTEKKEDKKIGI